LAYWGAFVNLRYYQSEAVDATWDFLSREPVKNPVVVLPTGAGKSHVVAKLCVDAVNTYGGRVMVLAHRKELIEQNASKLRDYLPVGIYSAGLKRRDEDDAVIVAGIQSVYDKAHLFGQRHLCIVDESHLVPFDGDGMYQQFLGDLRRYNGGFCRVVGLTATPFRTAGGALCRPDAIFQKVCYEAPLRKLIDEGFLSPIVNTPGDIETDLSGVKIVKGEFAPGAMENAFDATVEAACREIVTKTAGRKSILVFCAGVTHAEHVREKLEGLLRDAVGLVTGESLPLERAGILSAFRGGHLRVLVNVDVLTTGFDHPGIDAIAVLRATMSPGLFVQMCGRGSRKAPEKFDCLLLDFGGNLSRHGPIDDVKFGRRSDGTMVGEAPVKACPGCGEEVLISLRQCPCGFMFPPPENDRHGAQADEESAVLAEPITYTVQRVEWARHNKKNAPEKPPTLRVDYFTDGNLGTRVSEWVCLEHDGFARRKAEAWWKEHSLLECPATVDSALRILDAGGAVFANVITVGKEKGFDRIMKRELPPRPDLGDAFEVPPVETWADAEMPF
jgi:DNA repair protein RadD